MCVAACLVLVVDGWRNGDEGARALYRQRGIVDVRVAVPLMDRTAGVRGTEAQEGLRGDQNIRLPSIVHILFPCIRGFNLIIPNESLLTFLFIRVL